MGGFRKQGIIENVKRGITTQNETLLKKTQQVEGREARPFLLNQLIKFFVNRLMGTNEQ